MLKINKWLQGANSHGQLGFGYKSEQELEPKEVSLGDDLKAENILAIAGGAGHTLILDNNGRVYCCGWNNKGQLGISDDTFKFQEIEILKGFKVVQIACGWDFSTALTDCGKLLVWGNNAYTQLGLSKTITCTGIPSLLQVSQKLATGFKEVSCGLRHMAIINKDEEILVAGNGNKGELGIGDNYNENNYVSISKLPNIEGVKSIACGEHHTIMLRSDGTVLGWGDNKYGQLAIDPNVPHSFVPSEVFNNESLQKVYAGWSHSAASTSNGEIFIWGRNSYGQLGSNRDVTFKPEKIQNLKDVKDLSLGSEHNLAVTKDSKLYTWGWNEHGNCGTGDTNNVTKPKIILPNYKVKYAAACTGHSFAVVE